MSAITEIWTDGACEPNPGNGGWAFVIPSLAVEKYGGESNTTNNRMEMRAVIEALRHKVAGSVVISSDSVYAINVISGKWKAKTNLDLVAEARALMKGRRIGFRWVKGHNGDRNNERCDTLAEIGRKAHMQSRPKRVTRTALDQIDWKQW